MQIYPIDAIAPLAPKDVDTIAERNDNSAQETFDAHKEELLPILGKQGFERLNRLYSNSMKKVGWIYNFIKNSFHVRQPEAIYNINLANGEVEINKNSKRVRYSTSVVSSFTTTVWRFWTASCGQIDIVMPPMKSPERTIAKILEERIKEHNALINKNMKDLSQLHEKNDESSFWNSLSLLEDHCPTVKELRDLYKQERRTLIESKRVQKAFKEIKEDDLIPKDIFRLSVLVKFPEQINTLVKHFEKNFSSYIKFTPRDDNQYEKTLSQNPRFYFDRKKTAILTMPDTDEQFYIEFQFKQRNMFYAHIRSHKAYEVYREAKADFERTHSLADKKRCNDAENLCLAIHKNAVHQSNFYLMSEISWGDDNDRTYIAPLTSNGQYIASQDMIKNNYLIDDYDTPFDGATAFSTNGNEHLNKCCYLKLIGILPENFDEMDKGAKARVNKAWYSLTPMDIENFNKITEAAIRYQEVIREKQRAEKEKDDRVKRHKHKEPILDIDPQNIL